MPIVTAPSAWPMRLRPMLGHPLLCLGLAIVGQQVILAGQLWLGGALLLTGALLFATSTPAAADVPTLERPNGVAAPGGHLRRWIAALALVAVTLIGAAFRLYRLGSLPPGLAPDEARLGLAAATPIGDGPGIAGWGGWPILHWLTVASVSQFGHSALAVRLPAIVAGILYAPALFFLGRQLGGIGLATAAGVLGAVSFWHADLTRGAWGYVAWGLTLETVAVGLLLKAARERRTSMAALGGAALGVALQVSWGALAGLLGVAAWLLVSRRRGQSQAPVGLGTAITVPFAIYFLLAIGPILIGLTTPDRAIAATMVEGAVSEPGSASIPEAIGRVALMFNVAGDPSPLHNLGGEPTLDRVTAPLAVLGLALALAHLGRPARMLLVVWLAAALLPAVLAARSGGPDSLATIHAASPIFLLAGLALTSVSRGVRANRRTPSRVYADLFVLVLVVIFAINAHTLFVRRAGDPATWTAYASAEAQAAQALRPLAASSAVYLADSWLNHPTIRFLAPEISIPRPIDPTTVPFVEDQSMVYFAPGTQNVIADDLERIYSDGEIDHYRLPIDGSIVGLSFKAPSSVIADEHGVTLRVTTADRTRQQRQVIESFDVSWPLAVGTASTGTLDLSGTASAPVEGWYRLRLDGPPGSQLEVNGLVVLEAGQERQVFLARGSQRVRVVAQVAEPTRVRLSWAPPGAAELEPIPPERLFREQRAADGLLAYYIPGTASNGPPLRVQVDRFIQRLDSEPPLPRPYTAVWVGTLDVPKTAIYRLALDASGPASVWIDDQPVVTGVRSRDDVASALLTDGDHNIRIKFADEGPTTRFDLLWAAPGEPLTSIPTSRFTTPDGLTPPAPPELSGGAAPLPGLGQVRVRWLASTEGEPRAVAAGPDGTVYTSTRPTPQLQRIDPNGAIGTPIDAVGAASISDIDVGGDGRIWALDSVSGQVLRFEADGSGPTSVGPANGLYRPRGLGLALDGTAYIADTGGNRIVRVAEDGSVTASIGPDVGGPGQIRQPTDVAVSSTGDLFVVNGEDGAVLHLTPDGRYVGHWNVMPSDTERGSHLAFASDGALWITEPDGRRLSRFAQDGTPAGIVNETREGRVLRGPVGLAIARDGTIYVSDVSLRAIVALAPGSR